MTHVKLILNHMHYYVYADGSKDSEETEVKSLDGTLTVSGTS